MGTPPSHQVLAQCCPPRSLSSMIAMMGMSAVVAMITAGATRVGVFLVLISLAVMFAYGASASIVLAILSCVPRELQPLSMSLSTFGIHLLGDVPSPIVIGAMKGWFAPLCVVEAGVPGHKGIHLNPHCAEDRGGLRLTLVLTVSYLFTALFWWLVALVICRRGAKQNTLNSYMELSARGGNQLAAGAG